MDKKIIELLQKGNENIASMAESKEETFKRIDDNIMALMTKMSGFSQQAPEQYDISKSLLICKDQQIMYLEQMIAALTNQLETTNKALTGMNLPVTAPYESEFGKQFK